MSAFGGKADMTHSKLNALMFAFGVKRTSRDYLVCCRHLLDQRKVYPWPKGGLVLRSAARRTNLYSVFMNCDSDSHHFFIVRRYFIGTAFRVLG